MKRRSRSALASAVDTVNATLTLGNANAKKDTSALIVQQSLVPIVALDTEHAC